MLAFIEQLTSITPVLTALVGGGAIGAFFTFLSAKGKQDLDGLKLLLEERKQDAERLRKSEEDLKEHITRMEAEIARLRTRLDIMESAHHDLPVSQWLKDPSGVMLSLNRRYETDYLINMGMRTEDYIGKTDYEVWSKETADAFIDRDKRVYSDPKGYLVEIENLKAKDGTVYESVLVIKYQRKIGGVVIGIGGIAIPMSYIKKAESGKN